MTAAIKNPGAHSLTGGARLSMTYHFLFWFINPEQEESMEDDDLDEYEGIFNDDEVVDMILFGEVEKGVQKKKNSGSFTTLVAISGGALFGLLFIILK
jgi:hypothetical protein